MHGQPPALVAEHAPDDAADQQARHLTVEQEQPLGGDLVLGRVTELEQARLADRPEQDQIVNIDEVTEGCDDDGQRRCALRGALRDHAAILRVIDPI